MMSKGIRRLPVTQGDNTIGKVNVMSVIGHIYMKKKPVLTEKLEGLS